MVSSIVGNYLIEKGLITSEQFRDLIAEQRRVRVKLGLIAVAEGLMTQEETDNVNRLQAVMDKRFGDIAVEKGYLTEGQVESLLKKQGNAYLAFAQVLENQQLMSIEQLEQYLIDFQCENHLTASDMEAIKSDDVDRILPLYLPVGSESYAEIAGTAVRALIRLVDAEIYPKKAYIASELEADNGAWQYVEGNSDFNCAMAGKGDALLHTASVFGQEEFAEMNDDALDAVGELLNCMNGLYVSAKSKEGISLELMPPEYSARFTKLVCNKMLVLPLRIQDKTVNFLIAFHDKIEMN